MRKIRIRKRNIFFIYIKKVINIPNWHVKLSLFITFAYIIFHLKFEVHDFFFTYCIKFVLFYVRLADDLLPYTNFSS